MTLSTLAPAPDRCGTRRHVGPWFRRGAFATTLAVILGAVPALMSSPCPSEPAPALADLLRNRLQAGAAQGTLRAGGHEIRASNALPSFYLRREDAPAWISRGRPSSCALRLVAALHAAPEDGLDGTDYHLAAIDSLVSSGRDAAGLVDLEILPHRRLPHPGLPSVSGAGESGQSRGRVAGQPTAARHGSNPGAALASGDVDGALRALPPAQPGYRLLREALADLRAIDAAGGSGTIPAGSTLHPGEEDPRVPPLRRRLRSGGDLVLANDVGGASIRGWPPLWPDSSWVTAWKRTARWGRAPWKPSMFRSRTGSGRWR